MAKYALAAAVLCGFVAGGWWLFRLQAATERTERERFEKNEVEFLMFNLANASIDLVKTGASLDHATSVAIVSERMWLPAGNYFLTARRAGKTWFFPVPLLGYRRGPEKDGSFTVTVRSLPDELPPRLGSKGPHFVYVPSGESLIGDRFNPRERHYVWSTAFFMSPFEVTNEQFRKFLEDPDGYANDAHWTSAGQRWKTLSRSHATALLRTSDPDYARFGRPDHPVVWVTWYEARAFCAWMTKTLGGGRWLFSLPTDAEWEKAARGPDNFDYALGTNISDNEVELYNWKKNPHVPVTVVGIDESTRGYRPNRYGLYHMTGNTAEWSQSVNMPYNRENPYRDDHRNDSDTRGPRSARGGSWYSAAISYLYIPYRDFFQPEHSSQELGFRVVAKLLP